MRYFMKLTNSGEILVEKYTRTIIGKNILYRVFCPKCDDYLLLPKNKLSCDCGSKFFIEGVSENDNILCRSLRKKKLSKDFKELLIKKFNNTCVYCRNEIGSVVSRNNKIFTLKAAFDHFVPYAYLQTNPDDNYILSCNVCNGIKSDLIFEDIDTARHYINKKLHFKNIEVV